MASKDVVPAEPVPVLRFKRLSVYAIPPVRSSRGAAGYDLHSAKNIDVLPLSNAVIPTDLMLQLPDGCYGRIAPRSGLAAKFFIDVGAGVIDRDYRGNVAVVLFNFSKHVFHIRRGDRIAQLIIERIYTPTFVEDENLDETARGTDGFGSTGIGVKTTTIQESK
ncbi:ORF2 [Falcon aviadenovirus A]|nr:ORF2 [Falcon aviadenovirus A]